MTAQSKDNPAPKKRHHNRINMERVLISIPSGLLEMVDKAAAKDFSNRSELIRTALLWYLRPQGRDLAQTDPDFILKTLQHRRLSVAMKKRLRDVKPTDE